MADFSQIYLSDSELAVLSRISGEKVPRAKIDADMFRRLKALGFVSVTFSPGGDDMLQITEPGRSFLIFNRERKKQNRISWVQFLIPTFLSLISLGISIATRVSVG